MQLIITLKPQNKLILPLSYHHVIQGLIYNLLKQNPEHSVFLHNTGYGDNSRRYKLFCFSQLNGHYTIEKKTIIFDDIITLEIRSPIDEFITIIKEALLLASPSNPININNQSVEIIDLSTTNNVIDKNKATIVMNTPLCLNNTIIKDGKRYTKYYNPLDNEFKDLIYKNSIKKYQSINNKNIVSLFSLTPNSISAKDKYVTKFKDKIYITAWKGTFSIEGPTDLINFLYNTGLGSKNSQGFGMFDYIP